jgi:hypothetical protein
VLPGVDVLNKMDLVLPRVISLKKKGVGAF